MIDINELRGRMVAKGYTQTKMAKELGITTKTFHLKLKKGIFNSDEMSRIVAILNIEDPLSIFFKEKVT